MRLKVVRIISLLIVWQILFSPFSWAEGQENRELEQKKEAVSRILAKYEKEKGLRLSSKSKTNFSFTMQLTSIKKSKEGIVSKPIARVFIQCNEGQITSVVTKGEYVWAVYDKQGLWVSGSDGELLLSTNKGVTCLVDSSNKGTANKGIYFDYSLVARDKQIVNVDFQSMIRAIVEDQRLGISFIDADSIIMLKSQSKYGQNAIFLDLLKHFPVEQWVHHSAEGISLRLLAIRVGSPLKKIVVEDEKIKKPGIKINKIEEGVSLIPPRNFPINGQQKKVSDFLKSCVHENPKAAIAKETEELRYLTKRISLQDFDEKKRLQDLLALKMPLNEYLGECVVYKNFGKKKEFPSWDYSRQKLYEKFKKDKPVFSELAEKEWSQRLVGKQYPLFFRKQILRILGDLGLSKTAIEELKKVADKHPELNPYWAVCFARHGQASPEDLKLLHKTLHDKQAGLWDRLESFEALSVADDIAPKDVNVAIDLLNQLRPGLMNVRVNGYWVDLVARYTRALGYTDAGMAALWEAMEGKKKIQFSASQVIPILDVATKGKPGERKKFISAMMKFLLLPRAEDRMTVFYACSLLKKEAGDGECRAFVQQALAKKDDNLTFNAVILAKQLNKHFDYSEDFLKAYGEANGKTRHSIVRAFSYPDKRSLADYPSAVKILSKGLSEAIPEIQIRAALGLAVQIVQKKWMPTDKEKDAIVPKLFLVTQLDWPKQIPNILLYRVWKAMELCHGEEIPIGLPKGLEDKSPYQSTEAFQWWANNNQVVKKAIAAWKKRMK